MDPASETRPLLRSFENETWRTRAKRRCLRVPSEVTITGVILGLFLVVVTLLIVFQDMEAEKKEELTLDNKLLASPFKFNKKAEDKTWQDRKAGIIEMKKQKQENYKFDTVNKGWKKFPDISGKIYSSDIGNDLKLLKQSSQALIYPPDKTEYGKEIDDSLESILNLKTTESSAMKKFNQDTAEIKSLLHSGINWKELDEGWKTLSEKGWKDKDIRRALFIALKEKRKELMEADGILQSPINLDDFWDKISDSWTEKIPDGNKHMERQKKINDEWKGKMSVQQSPKTSIKQYIKEDEGQQKLSDSGWKKKEIEEALINALKEKENVLQSPMNIPGLWGKGTNFLNNLFHKGTSEKTSQMDMNDKWKNKFNVLQSSSKMNYNKWKDSDGYKKNKNDWKDNVSDNTNNEDDDMQQPPVTIEGIVEKIIDAIMAHLKELEDKKSEKIENENNQLMQSPSNVEDLIKIIEMIKDKQRELKDQNSEEIGNDDNKPTKSSTNAEDFLEKIIEIIKYQHKGIKDKNSNAIDTDDNEPMQSPTNVEDNFLRNLLDEIKDFQKGNKEKQKDINDEWKNGMQPSHTTMKKDNKWKEVNDHWKTLIEHERNTVFGKNDKNSNLKPTDSALQHSMSLDDEKINDSWKKLTGQGWKDKDLSEAINKAWKNGDRLLQSAIGDNIWKWKKVNDGWKKISNKSISVPTKCPISKYHRELLLGSSMPAPPIDCALIAEEVRREYGRCIDLSFLPQECKPSWREKCFSTYIYRKPDGTCNNKIHPAWGRSGTPFVRMIAPDYADGVSAIRTAKNGGPLPNPRLLSRKLYSRQTKPDSDTSVLFMYFGLLVDHDMVETAVNSDSIPCCDETFIANPQSRPKECLQIDIPNDDPFYGPRNVKCLSLTRSVPVTGECGGRREQLNKATHYLDGSVVYGSGFNQAKQLRTFSRGQLRTQLINGTPFMAPAEGAGYSCGTPDEPHKCFEAGDSRVNMMVELTAMHTLWYREHNRIATELLKLNPQWKDELIYQETRRILIAELQHITYSEFLPILLGKKAMEDYELSIDESKNYEGYDDTVDPSVFNVFGAAAFRFGHSLAPDMQYLLGANNSTADKVPLHETFFNADILYHNGLDLLIRGAASQRTQSVDTYITTEVREHLFQPSDLDYGYDLAAVGIQRGRDHGLPPYLKWRSVCGLPEIKTWDDLYTVMDKDRADMFKTVYQSVDDIDLIPGALAEHHEEASLLGPTYTCLIGRQFKKTRKGDRFWFEIQNEIHSLTKDQLSEIYKSSMARILCDNADNIKEIQRYPMKVPSNQNVILDCDAIPKVDLSKWKSKV